MTENVVADLKQQTDLEIPQGDVAGLMVAGGVEDVTGTAAGGEGGVGAAACGEGLEQEVRRAGRIKAALFKKVIWKRWRGGFESSAGLLRDQQWRFQHR